MNNINKNNQLDHGQMFKNSYDSKEEAIRVILVNENTQSTVIERIVESSGTSNIDLQPVIDAINSIKLPEQKDVVIHEVVKEIHCDKNHCTGECSKPDIDIKALIKHEISDLAAKFEHWQYRVAVNEGEQLVLSDKIDRIPKNEPTTKQTNYLLPIASALAGALITKLFL